MNGHGARRAVLYARVSTEEQAKTGYSIPEQLRELRAYAAREGYRVVEEAVDDGHSGADPHRPGLRRVCVLPEAGYTDSGFAQKSKRVFRHNPDRPFSDQNPAELRVRHVVLVDH